jgi:hypothetical protein
MQAIGYNLPQQALELPYYHHPRLQSLPRVLKREKTMVVIALAILPRLKSEEEVFTSGQKEMQRRWNPKKTITSGEAIGTTEV